MEYVFKSFIIIRRFPFVASRGRLVSIPEAMSSRSFILFHREPRFFKLEHYFIFHLQLHFGDDLTEHDSKFERAPVPATNFNKPKLFLRN